jgi:hypothetical protein
MLRVTGRDALLTRQWADALEGVVVRHPNRSIELILTLEDGPMPCLTFELDKNLNSDDDEVIAPFNIVNVRLTYFPGVMLARQWLAAAWGCFLQHEALELVTVGDPRERVLDPHLKRSRLDVFHRGFPFRLTPESLLIALATAIPYDEALYLTESAA